MTFVVAALVISLVLSGILLVPSRSAVGMQQSGKEDEPASGTPVAAAAEPNDPLDGDPLDGPTSDDDPGAPVDQRQLEIVRSARPHDAPAAVAVYDEDPRTVWMPHADAGETWL